MMETNSYLMLFKPKRADFLSTLTEEELSIMQAHGAHCRELAAKGKVVLLGVCTNGAYGVMVFRAGSEDEARSIFEEDPAVKAGVVLPELHPFVTAIPS